MRERPKFIKSILLADDDSGFRGLIRFMFGPLGLVVVMVEDGLETLKMIRQRCFETEAARAKAADCLHCSSPWISTSMSQPPRKLSKSRSAP